MLNFVSAIVLFLIAGAMLTLALQRRDRNKPTDSCGAGCSCGHGAKNSCQKPD